MVRKSLDDKVRMLAYQKLGLKPHCYVTGDVRACSRHCEGFFYISIYNRNGDPTIKFVNSRTGFIEELPVLLLDDHLLMLSVKVSQFEQLYHHDFTTKIKRGVNRALKDNDILLSHGTYPKRWSSNHSFLGGLSFDDSSELDHDANGCSYPYIDFDNFNLRMWCLKSSKIIFTDRFSTSPIGAVSGAQDAVGFAVARANRILRSV